MMRKFLSIVLVVLALVSIELITSYAYYENDTEEMIADELDLPDGEYIETFNTTFVDPVLHANVENEGVLINDPLEGSANRGNGSSTFMRVIQLNQQTYTMNWML